MVKINDLYGSDDDLETTRVAVEHALGIRMVLHESLYFAGLYYRYETPAGENFVLRRNVDPFDDEPAESEFPAPRVLLYVERTERPKEIQQLLREGTPRLTLLRSKEAYRQ